jgi:hypothetical protein
MMRPVNSSTIFTSPSWTTYSTSRWYSDSALRAWMRWLTSCAFLRVVEILDPEGALDLLDRLLARRDRLELLVVLVVGAVVLHRHALGDELRGHALELLRDPREVVVRLGRRLRLARDDERRPRLVDQDRVDLVDDRVGMPALDGGLEGRGHVVAEVVEAELRVRAVRDVGVVRGLALVEGHHVADEGRPHAEGLVDRAHPLGVALGQVVVHRHEVDVPARERVQVERHGGDERLSFAGLHLGDVALVEHHRAHELDVERAQPESALRRFADGRERLEDELVELLAVLEPLLELGGLPLELLVRKRLEAGLERGDVVRLFGELLEAPALADPQEFLECSVVLGHQLSRVPNPRAGLCRFPRGRGQDAWRGRNTRRSGLRRLLRAPESPLQSVARRSRAHALPPGSWSASALPLDIGRKLRNLDPDPPIAHVEPCWRIPTARYGGSRASRNALARHGTGPESAPRWIGSRSGTTAKTQVSPLVPQSAVTTASHSRVRGIPEIPASTQRNALGSVRSPLRRAGAR